MEYRRLGRTGLKVSTICLGTMQFGWTADEKRSHMIMSKAVDIGCNFFDTANVYSSWYAGNKGGESESIIGSWLRSGKVRREDIIIASKVRGKMGDGPNDQGLSRHHILNAIDASLKRLNCEYIDLYQVHYPDDETPLEETLQALDDLIRMGKVRYAGCSNYPAWLLTKSLWVSDVKNLCRFETLQPHYNYIHRDEFERELLAVCEDQDIGVIPYSPLGGGFLTGKYQPDSSLPDSDRASGVKRRYMNDRGFSALHKLEEIANRHNATIAQVAIAWVLATQTVASAVIGANTIDQLVDTAKGADLTLTNEEKTELDRMTKWDQ